MTLGCCLQNCRLHPFSYEPHSRVVEQSEFNAHGSKGVSITSGRSSRCAAWKQNWDSLLVGLTWMLLLTSWTRVPRLFRLTPEMAPHGVNSSMLRPQKIADVLTEFEARFGQGKVLLIPFSVPQPGSWSLGFVDLVITSSEQFCFVWRK